MRTANNAALRTKQKWDANKENNKIRIHKHIKKASRPFRGGPALSPAVLQTTQYNSLNKL